MVKCSPCHSQFSDSRRVNVRQFAECGISAYGAVNECEKLLLEKGEMTTFFLHQFRFRPEFCFVCNFTGV